MGDVGVPQRRGTETKASSKMERGKVAAKGKDTRKNRREGCGFPTSERCGTKRSRKPIRSSHLPWKGPGREKWAGRGHAEVSRGGILKDFVSGGEKEAEVSQGGLSRSYKRRGKLCLEAHYLAKTAQRENRRWARRCTGVGKGLKKKACAGGHGRLPKDTRTAMFMTFDGAMGVGV